MHKPFRIHKSKDKGYYLTTVAENGRTLDTTETYVRKRSCVEKVRALFRLTKSLIPEHRITDYIEDLTIKPKQK